MKMTKKTVLVGALSLSLLAAGGPVSAFAAGTSSSNTTTQQVSTQAANKIPAVASGEVKRGEVTAQGIRTKVAAALIRKSGWLIEHLGSKISKKGASKLNANIQKIASYIEKANDLQEKALATFLISLGVPPADAIVTAHWLVMFFGW